MRLIDADALMRELKRRSNQAAEARMGLWEGDFVDLVNDADVVEVPQWIPATERLPEKAGDYLCVCNDGESREPYVVIIQYNDEREAFGHEANVYDPVTFGFVDTEFEEWPVTHWMPLPEPPEVV